MIVARTVELAEDLLATGALRCPRCRAPELTAWGYGRERAVRSHAGVVVVRPRRVRCRGCGSTHIVLPAALQPRRADTTAVIGTALQHKADGRGYRHIAGPAGSSGVDRAALAASRDSRAPAMDLPARDAAAGPARAGRAG